VNSIIWSHSSNYDFLYDANYYYYQNYI